MEFKNHAQRQVIDDLLALNDQLGAARNAYLLKEAERDHFESCLIREAGGKSNAESVVLAKSTDEWLVFHKELARLEAVFEFMKLKFRLLENEYQSQYLETKLNDAVIKKGF